MTYSILPFNQNDTAFSSFHKIGHGRGGTSRTGHEFGPIRSAYGEFVEPLIMTVDMGSYLLLIGNKFHDDDRYGNINYLFFSQKMFKLSLRRALQVLTSIQFKPIKLKLDVGIPYVDYDFINDELFSFLTTLGFTRQDEKLFSLNKRDFDSLYVKNFKKKFIMRIGEI